MHDSDRQLLKQFCRGCWDGALITNIQLEQRIYVPPSFAELLLLLRTEEDKRANKVNRMQRHLGLTKQRVMSHMQAAHLSYTNDDDSEKEAENSFLDVTNQIQKQIADLQLQIAKLSASGSGKHVKEKGGSTKHKHKSQSTQSDNQYQSVVTADNNQLILARPKPWYCFNCGEDGHVASTCSSRTNPTLVQAKRAQLREKHREWDVQHNVTTVNLNENRLLLRDK